MGFVLQFFDLDGCNHLTSLATAATMVGLLLLPTVTVPVVVGPIGTMILILFAGRNPQMFRI